MAVEEGCFEHKFIRLTGRIVRRTATNYNVELRCELATGVVDVDGMEFDVQGRDKEALELAAILPGSEVTIEGDPELHTWTTADQTDHSQFLVLAKRLTVLSTPK